MGKFPPRILSKNIERKRVKFILQRTELEIFTKAGNFSGCTMPIELVLQSKAVLLLGNLVENEHSVLALLIGLGKITPLNHINSHKAEEIPRNRIRIYIYLLPLESPAPTHTGRIHQRTCRPGNILYMRRFKKFIRKRIPL